ncbi:hypothetical protein GCM10025865_05580 [Paraoerskovia sediminicola]|uniref:Uncharacterized protein n=1 Tax=Paraoerskovia sediminicola TaxID=1138587 RepID=A0ABN6X9A9_9CELL|nr:hypothetical protein [Paraoerskovia sediminicola]BDZ41259.1 hypothetical protein GCM10025865_05580 [Paraoerskovia sediminicola]
MTTRYAPGSGLAVVRGEVGVLLPVAPSEAVVDELWETLGAAAGVVDVIQVVAGSSALRDVPAFGAVVLDEDGAHVVVRGPVEVTMTTADRTVVVSGAGAATWSERRETDVSAASLVLLDAPERPDEGPYRSLPVTAAVVAARSVDLSADPSADPSADRSAGGDVVVSSGKDPTERVVAPAAATAAAAPSPEPVAGPRSEPAAAGGPQRAEQPFGQPAPAPAPSPDPAPAPTPVEPPETSGAPGPVPPAASDGSDTNEAYDEIDGFTHLWGATVRSGVEDAAVRPVDEDAAVRPVDEDAAAALSELPGDGGGLGSSDDAGAREGSREGGREDHRAQEHGAGQDLERDLERDTDAETIVPEATAASVSTSESTSVSTEGPAGSASPGLVAGLPDWSGAAAQRPARAATDPAEGRSGGDLDDLDESTMHSSVIAALRASASGGPSGEGGRSGHPVPGPAGGAIDATPGAASDDRPRILASVCADGHANPPTYGRCAACDATLGESRGPCRARSSGGSSWPTVGASTSTAPSCSAGALAHRGDGRARRPDW